MSTKKQQHKARSTQWGRVKWMVGLSVLAAATSVAVNQAIIHKDQINADAVFNFTKGFMMGCSGGLLVFLGLPWLFLRALGTSLRGIVYGSRQSHAKAAVSNESAVSSGPPATSSTKTPATPADNVLGRLVYCSTQFVAGSVVGFWPLALTLLCRVLPGSYPSSSTQNCHLK
eukprot:Gregarina_sp_Poly_1__3407@NODE_1989_length_2932_cov_153_970681_g1283_i0_p2_GENE_NODE_1989_length_2932_cov_153_970681_g1283_i0NODE_1989_length_2932_cov_153_970681_g1283_i0_p2_ORF_typecomplete_len172_score7_70DUF4212/PF13937_6/0_35DUF4212/PF13937_6/5_2e03_NODE_1989_length_2932_cov_153_970681_g1283_i011341649